MLYQPQDPSGDAASLYTPDDATSVHERLELATPMTPSPFPVRTRD